MKLSTRSRYGLRAAVALARSANGRGTSETVAEQEEVSKKYLDSILGTLREAGLLTTARGPGGGYLLTRAPEEITAADVVEALEGEISIVPCVAAPETCDRADACPTRGVWRAASEAVHGVLAGLTLADLAESGSTI